MATVAQEDPDAAAATVAEDDLVVVAAAVVNDRDVATVVAAVVGAVLNLILQNRIDSKRLTRGYQKVCQTGSKKTTRTEMAKS